MEKHIKIASLYVATLKAIAFIHQQCHWLSKGDNFYGDHLLFERLYNSALEDIDSAAEKFIGLFGVEALDYSMQVQLMNKVLGIYNDSSNDLVGMALSVERDFLKLNSECYKIFEQSGHKTLGLDDMLAAIANNREESCYLLQQVKK